MVMYGTPRDSNEMLDPKSAKLTGPVACYESRSAQSSRVGSHRTSTEADMRCFGFGPGQETGVNTPGFVLNTEIEGSRFFSKIFEGTRNLLTPGVHERGKGLQGTMPVESL